MKKLLSILFAVLLVVTMLCGSASVTMAASVYRQLGQFGGNAWQGTADLAGLSVNAYNFTPSSNWMVAAGYTVTTAGTYDLSGSVLIDAATVSGVAENANTFDFMIFERKSNTMVYPAAKSAFLNMKNTALNRSAVTPFSAGYTAKAGDEFIFLVRNNLQQGTPSLQVLADLYRIDGGNRQLVTSNYDDFSGTQGAKGWRYYGVSETGFTMPAVSKTAVSEITNGFVQCQHFNKNWWGVNAQSSNNANSPFYGIVVGQHTQAASPGYMVARGFTVKEDGPVSFSGTVMLDIHPSMGVPENVDTIGFMVIEKNSNTVLYPSGSAAFTVYKNTANNRTKPALISGSFEAKAGDEILFITRNETSSQRPSAQVIMNIYAEKEDGPKLLGNTHEGFSGTQGRNNWRYYYASNSTFKTPVVPAQNIFSAAAHYDSGNNAWFASQAAMSDKVISSFGASVTAGSVTATAKTAVAVGYKAPKAGNVNFSFSHEALPKDGAVGFSVVKKSTFERVYPNGASYKALQGGSETLSGSFKAFRGDEYLFVFTVLNNGEDVNIPLTLTVGGATLAGKFSDKNDGAPFRYYFAPTVSVYEAIFKEKMTVTPYMADDEQGIRDVTFDMSVIGNFDEEKWMWTVGGSKNAFENPASPAFMAVQGESSLVSNRYYSSIRTYTAQTDCTLNINGNLLTEVPEYMGQASQDSRLDYMICNSKGQIVYPTDQSGFFTFHPQELRPDKPMLLNVNVKLKAGESLYFIGRNRTDKDYVYFYNYFVLTESPDDASKSPVVVDFSGSFSDKQGQDGWRYYYASSDAFRFLPGTVLDKPAGTGKPGGNTDDKNNADDQAQKTGSTVNPVLVAFYVTVSVDILAIAAIVLLVVWKLRQKKAAVVAAEAPTSVEEEPPEA